MSDELAEIRARHKYDAIVGWGFPIDLAFFAAHEDRATLLRLLDEAAKREELLREWVQTAMGALADIANAEDMTDAQRRHKASRIYMAWAVVNEDGGAALAPEVKP